MEERVQCINILAWLFVKMREVIKMLLFEYISAVLITDNRSASIFAPKSSEESDLNDSSFDISTLCITLNDICRGSQTLEV